MGRKEKGVRDVYKMGMNRACMDHFGGSSDKPR